MPLSGSSVPTVTGEQVGLSTHPATHSSSGNFFPFPLLSHSCPKGNIFGTSHLILTWKHTQETITVERTCVHHFKGFLVPLRGPAPPSPCPATTATLCHCLWAC